MRLVLVDGHSRPDQGVEDRGGELRHPAADVVDEHALFDETAFHEALRLSSPADVSVQREALAGFHDCAAHEVGEAVDVLDAALAARVLRGERGDELDDAQGFQMRLLLPAHCRARRQRERALDARQQRFGDQ